MIVEDEAFAPMAPATAEEPSILRHLTERSWAEMKEGSTAGGRGLGKNLAKPLFQAIPVNLERASELRPSRIGHNHSVGQV